MSEVLAKLEDLRLTEPKKAIEEVKRALAVEPAELVPSLLGEWASCLRKISKITHGLDMIRLAKDHARALKSSPHVMGDLLQRQAYLEAEIGRFNRALKLTDRATLLHLEAQHLRGVGRTFVDRGVFLFHQEKYEASNGAYFTALQYLEADQELSIYSVEMNLCLNFFHIKNYEASHKFCLKAQKRRNVPPTLRKTAMWVVAEFDLKNGKYHEAADSFEAIAGYFLEIGEPLNAALATTLLAKSLLLSGKPDQALDRAREMARFLQPLEKERVVAAAISELVSCAHSARKSISEKALARAIGSLRQAKYGAWPQAMNF